ncbi:MAG TPA: hypothetical protein VIM30_13965 [Candidatus Limnocylindrales bacterium]|jgi:hypothetical protein
MDRLLGSVLPDSIADRLRRAIIPIEPTLHIRSLVSGVPLPPGDPFLAQSRPG